MRATWRGANGPGDPVMRGGDVVVAAGGMTRAAEAGDPAGPRAVTLSR
jgi:hypothetical protein